MSRRQGILVGVTLLLLAGFYITSTFQRCCSDEFAWDFAINWTAAKGMQAGMSVYDQEGLQDLGKSLIGPIMAEKFQGLFYSYVSPPSTAFMLLPFAGWTFPTSLAIYRGASVLAFMLAVVIAGLALPPRDRKMGWWFGILGLFLADPVIISLRLGQVDAWITLALAASLWAISKERWGLAGIGIGIATLLKISPALLALYCLLRGRWQTALVAALTALIMLWLTIAAGDPSDLERFAFSVLPSLSRASLHIQNQSLPAWLARIFLPETDLTTFAIDIGRFRFISVVLVAGFVGLLWNNRRGKALLPLEVALLVVAAMLIGPLTWDHYISWSLVFVVLVSHSRWWSGGATRSRRNMFWLLLLSGFLFTLPNLYFSIEEVASFWALRLVTGTKTLGLLAFLVVGMHFLQRDTMQPIANVELER